jgi:hypothetical protein
VVFNLITLTAVQIFYIHSELQSAAYLLILTYTNVVTFADAFNIYRIVIVILIYHRHKLIDSIS